MPDVWRMGTRCEAHRLAAWAVPLPFGKLLLVRCKSGRTSCRTLYRVPAVHQICLASGVKRRAKAVAWRRQSDTTAHIEGFTISYLDDSSCKIIVFIDEVDLLIKTLLGANAAELSSWQLLEHAWSLVINPRLRLDDMVHVD